MSDPVMPRARRGMRACMHCWDFLPRAAFDRDPLTADRLATWCRTCAEERAARRGPRLAERIRPRWPAHYPDRLPGVRARTYHPKETP